MALSANPPYLREIFPARYGIEPESAITPTQQKYPYPETESVPLYSFCLC